MQRTERRIHPRGRLSVAIELIGRAETVADIGCDHGRLACALVQSGAAKRCVAVDVSQPSLGKAEALARRTGLSERVETRLGDGLRPLYMNEADAIAILGMGGTLMTRILGEAGTPLNGARVCVLQPMTAAEDIRRWLYERRYPVLGDRVAEESGRLYQVFSVGQPRAEADELPPGWPEDCFLLGYRAFAERDPLTRLLAARMLITVRRKLTTQRADALARQAAALEQIIYSWEDAR